MNLLNVFFSSFLWNEKAGFLLSKSKRSIYFLCIYFHSFRFLYFLIFILKVKKNPMLEVGASGTEDCLKCMERKRIDLAPFPKEFLNNISFLTHLSSFYLT